jgi:hypothetical protein
MGAYGHSHLSEWFFGSITRTVLRELVTKRNRDEVPKIVVEAFGSFIDNVAG